jgi:hypothetical protein
MATAKAQAPASPDITGTDPQPINPHVTDPPPVNSAVISVLLSVVLGIA